MKRIDRVTVEGGRTGEERDRAERLADSLAADLLEVVDYRAGVKVKVVLPE